MGTWRYFAENHLVALDEHLYAENAVATERVGHLAGDFAGLGDCGCRHRLWLPAFAIVAVDLNVAYRFAEHCARDAAHRKQRYLVVEIDEAFNDDTSGACAAAFLRYSPCLVDVAGFFDD